MNDEAVSHVEDGVAIRRAVRQDRRGATILLATAFARDPLIAAATDAARDPACAREAVFRTLISGTLLGGGELVLAERAGALIGAAIIADPQSGSALRVIRSSLARLVSGARFLMLASRLAPGALGLLNAADLASRRLAPSDPHHVLAAVGVDESARGLGVGRLLVEYAVDRARRDPRSWGIRLETENALNAERYGRWGFAKLGVVRLTAVDVHVMAQEARPHRRHEDDR